MQYLENKQAYYDRYDLLTIRSCIDTVTLYREKVAPQLGASDLKDISPEERERSLNYMLNMHLYTQKGERGLKKERTILEWMARDQEKQEKLDNIPVPRGVRCQKCGSEMRFTMKELIDHYDNLRVLVFFECSKCKTRMAIYDNGEEFSRKPEQCPKCKGDLTTETIQRKDKITWITTCAKCGFREEDVDDFKAMRKEREQREKKDQELMRKYRAEFCLSPEETEKYKRFKEVAAYANEVYEFEKSKFDDPVFDYASKVKKLSITELESLLNREFEKADFTRMSFEKPQMTRYVLVQFTVQDNDPGRKEKASKQLVKDIVDVTLADTNWRLENEGLAYRLGFITGFLRGYEDHEDLLRLAGVKLQTKPKELDQSKQQEYGHENLVQLAKMSGEYEGKRAQRLKRLEKESDGFLLLDESEGTFNCSLCHQSIQGKDTWWLKDGLLCHDCKHNLEAGVFPAAILEHRDMRFSQDDMQWEFGLHSATARKLIRQGVVKGREFKDKQGRVYFRLFLVEENRQFLKDYPQQREARREYFYFDENGNKVWL